MIGNQTPFFFDASAKDYFLTLKTGARLEVLQNTLARWKTVEILYESGDDYIVRWDDGSTSNLWPQDELILTNQTIENGMVMR